MTVCRKIPAGGPVVCFAPHPDDEVLGPGATLARHVAQGDPVTVVLATDGTAGDPERRFDPGTYAERRREESRAAARELGLRAPQFWGLPDSCDVAESDKVRLTGLVVDALREHAPSTVYLPWRGDNNADHQVLHEVVVRGLRQTGFVGDAWGYEVWAPNPLPDLVIDITDLRPPQGRPRAVMR